MTQTKIPAPWTPVSACETESGVTVSVWGRRYEFGHSLFPEHIYALGEDLLAAPIRVVGREGGAPMNFEAPDTHILEENDESVVIVSAVQSRFAVLNAVTTVWFDGFVKFDLRLSIRGNHIRAGVDRPLDTAKHLLDSLAIEIPLTEKTAKLRHNGNTNYNMKDSYNGAFVECGLPVMPFNWFGNDERGLGLYIESDENWQSADPARAVELENADGARIIRLRLLDSHPVKWAEEDRKKHGASWESFPAIEMTPLFYGICLQATPIKPYDRSQYRERNVHIDCFVKLEQEYSSYLLGPVSEDDPAVVLDRLKAAGITTLTLHEAWNPIQGYWKLRADLAEKTRLIVSEAHRRGMKVVAYFCCTLSSLRPEGRAYIERNCLISATGTTAISHYRQPPQRTWRTCMNGPDLADDLLCGMTEAIENFGFDGVYLDGVNLPRPCANEKHGCGYTAPDGSRHVTYAICRMMDCFRAIYGKLHDEMGKLIHIHPSNGFIPAVEAYSDFIWSGEHIALGIGKKRFGMSEVGDDYIRTALTGRNTGNFMQFITYEFPDGSWGFEKSLSLTAPYGLFPIPNDVRGPLDIMVPIWNALDKIDAAEAAFHPCQPGEPELFAGNTVGLTADSPAVRCGAFEKDGKWLLIVSNPTEQPLDGLTLALSCGSFETDALSGEKIGAVTYPVDLAPFSYRMFFAGKK